MKGALAKMSKKRMTNRKGFTLIELMIATGLASAVIVGVGTVLVDSQRGWNTLYERAYCDVVTDAHVARRTFDRVVRNASSQTISLDEAGTWVEVYTYSDPCSPVVDLYAKFQAKNGQLSIEYGDLAGGETLSIDPICGNVSSCVFKSSGRSVQMILTLDDGSKSITVVASAIMHN
jgi:prepilin-type N-terminal cleavage/methylation domain-containing protein